CMRDVSHQAIGALALGLAEHTRNMMHKFARGIAESRDWCSYWEINRHNKPAPVDYRSDEDFWYNLPANFDVIQAAYRAYEWTGDADYLEHPDFDAFYRHSLTDYVATWDDDGDGLLESPAENGTRGLATYWEGGGPRALTGADLVAAQYAASLAYSRVLTVRGQPQEAEPFAREADRLRRLFNDEWWDDGLGRFYTSIIQDGSFDTTYIPAMQIFPMYFGIVEPPRTDRLLQELKPGVNVEENSYLAEIFYRHGRHEAAFDHLLAQMDPALPRREYPENPFTAVGGVVRFLAGVNPIASEALIETRPRLPERVTWLRLEGVPVLQNQIAVHHDGNAQTRLANESGSALRWRAVFPGSHRWLLVDGARFEARVRDAGSGQSETFVTIDLGPGQSRTVKVE
ncbi:MAG TPA: hypothetical protein VLC48_01315, partial [Gemmatimonadota bacterium]|nr:hypothetical protein [Gemmatimonadota bacterium]